MIRRPFVVGLLLLLILASVAYAGGGAPTGPVDPAEIGKPEHLVMMIVYAAIALGFSFLCSVAEAVVLSISPSYIANLEKEGKKAASLVSSVKSNIDRSLAGILTLNTIAHTVGAGGAGAEAVAYFGPNYVGAAMAVLTLLILFASEIIPKTIGALYWRQLAPASCRFIQILVICLFPLIYVSEFLTKLLTRGKSAHGFSREEFKAMADIGAAGGLLDARESRILRNLFRLPMLTAADIMTPRTVVFAMQQDQTVTEVLKDNSDITFSRIPIYGEHRDDVTGFVLKSDILLNEYRHDGKAHLRDLKRDIRAVEESTPLGQVFEETLDNSAHILLVVDRYGGMAGVVTLEDVVETLIGIEIVDEGDKIDDMRRLAREQWEERMKRVGIDVREPDRE